MPGDLPDIMSENMPEDMPEDMPDRVPGDMPDRVPGDMPEHVPDRISEDTPDNNARRFASNKTYKCHGGYNSEVKYVFFYALNYNYIYIRHHVIMQLV